MAESNSAKRITWIDCAKGITILLVIIGHTLIDGYKENIIRGLIFSFHMPLFFILSCITYRFSKDYQMFWHNIKKSARHLLIPVLIIFLIRICFNLIQSEGALFFERSFWGEQFYSLFYASGVKSSCFDKEIPALGASWFLLALFIGRSLLDYIQMVFDKKQALIICGLFTVIGIWTGGAQQLPFSADIAMAVLPLMYLGLCCKNMKFPSERKKIVRDLFFLCAGWIVTLLIQWPDLTKRTYMELAVRRYPFGPFCYVSAVLGSWLVCEFSNALGLVLKRVSSLIEILGKYSLYMFCVHCIDYIWKPMWKVGENQYVWTARRMIWDLLAFAVVLVWKKVVMKRIGQSWKKSGKPV